ncbi:MAG: hypothetical protein LC768_16145 [Acidobacteria bacterium]|nr:hypothetical protein [Acidobacteriota bacterium]
MADRYKHYYTNDSHRKPVAANSDTYRVSGKTTHDARIVAAMQTHKIENLLTFNVSDFKRYSGAINIFAPQDVT